MFGELFTDFVRTTVEGFIGDISQDADGTAKLSSEDVVVEEFLAPAIVDEESVPSGYEIDTATAVSIGVLVPEPQPLFNAYGQNVAGLSAAQVTVNIFVNPSAQRNDVFLLDGLKITQVVKGVTRKLNEAVLLPLSNGDTKLDLVDPDDSSNNRTILYSKMPAQQYQFEDGDDVQVSRILYDLRYK